jgi:hypothetical protein
MRAPSAPAPHAALLGSVIVPADGTSAAHWRERRLRCVPVIWQLSGKPLLACKPTGGVPQMNNNEASVKISPKGPSAVVRFCGLYSGNWLSAAAPMQLSPIITIWRE